MSNERTNVSSSNGSTVTALFVASTLILRLRAPQFVIWRRSTALFPGHARVSISPAGCGAQQGGGISQLQPLLLGRGSLIDSSSPMPTFVPCSSSSPTAFAASASDIDEVSELMSQPSRLCAVALLRER